MLKFIKQSYPIFIILIIGLLLVSKLLSPGWYNSHDGIFHIYRTEEALSMLKLGQFPLRWAGNFDQGFGIPLFTFVYPLPYYLSALISYVIGTIYSLKLVTISAYLSGGLGMYYLFKKQGSFIAIFASLIYLLTPYQFLNIFVRGTIGETLAIGLIPWALVSFYHLSSSLTKKISWYHPVPLALALISHNFLGILFAVFLLGLALCNPKSLKKSLSSILISFALSAFFIIPMLTQKNFLYSFEYHDLTFRYDQHFVTLKQLFYGKWDYWYSVPGDSDGMSFQLGIAQLILSTLGIMVILIKNRSLPTLYLTLAYLGSIFLMHSKSYFIWENIALLKVVQFPWRFLFMPLILTPILAVELLRKIKSLKIQKIIMVIFLALALINIRNYRSPMKFLDNTEFTDLYRLYFNKTSTTFRTEILPKWSVPAERYKSDELLINSGNMTLENLVSTPLSLEFSLNNKPDESVAKVTLLRNYYPSWRLLDEDGNSLIIAPTVDGMISFTPLQGIHSYTLKQTSTSIERISNYLSLLALLLLGYLWQNQRNKSSKAK